MVRELFSAALKRAGYDVTVAADGADALPILHQTPRAIDLLITDIHMPVLSGTELAKEADHLGCPVLLMSGDPPPAEAAQAGWDFLAKPFAPSALIQAAKEMLNRNAPELKPDDGGRPRVIVAEDDAQVLQRLCAILRENYDVVAALDEGRAVLQKAEELKPEVILLDISMPGMNGFAVARVLHREMPAVPVLFVTQHADPIYISEAFGTGVAGYVLKSNAVTELGPAVEQVRSGGRYLSPCLQAR